MINSITQLGVALLLIFIFSLFIILMLVVVFFHIENQQLKKYIRNVYFFIPFIIFLVFYIEIIFIVLKSYMNIIFPIVIIYLYFNLIILKLNFFKYISLFYIFLISLIVLITIPIENYIEKIALEKYNKKVIAHVQLNIFESHQYFCKDSHAYFYIDNQIYLWSFLHKDFISYNPK